MTCSRFGDTNPAEAIEAVGRTLRVGGGGRLQQQTMQQA